MQFSIQTIFAIFAISLSTSKPITDIINIQGLTGNLLGDQLLRRSYEIISDSKGNAFSSRQHHRGQHHGHKGAHHAIGHRQNGIYRRDRGHANYGSRRNINRF